MIKIFLLFFILLSTFSFGQNSFEDDFNAILANFNKGNIEYGVLKIEKRNLAGDFAGVVSETLDRDLTKNVLKSVENFEERIEIVRKEIEEVKERAFYLKEGIEEGLSNNTLTEENNKGKDLLVQLEKIDDELSKKISDIEKSKIDINKWKSFLINKLQQDSRNSFSHFNLRESLVHPISQAKLFWEVDVKNFTLKLEKEFGRVSTVEGRVKAIGLLLIFGMSLFSIILILSKFQNSVMNNSFILGGNVSKGVFETIFKNKVIVSYFLSLHILRYFQEFYEEFSVFFFVSYFVLIPFLWTRCATPLIQLVYVEINKSEKEFSADIPKISFLLFYSFFLIENRFLLESDLISFFKDLLLIYLGVCFFKLSSQIKSDNVMSYLKKGSIFLSFLNIFTVLLSFLIAVGALISVVGFKKLGNELTGNIFVSVQHLFWSWFFYHLVIDLVINLKQRIQVKEFKDFFDNLIRTINFIFFIVFIYFIANNWAKEFLLVKSIGDIELFYISGAAIKFSQPFNLVLMFFAYNIIFHLVDASLKIVLDDDEITHGPRQTAHFSSVLKYIFIAFYIIHTFSILGVTYKNLILIASALGVGIGFGLQNIVNNFISGIILLFERPVRVGDYIEIDGGILQVKRIGIRSTMVVSFDNSCTVIPNSDILSNRLTNWTLNDNKIAMKCNVGVSYGTDPEKVSTLLEKCALETGGVLKSPAPRVLFTEFGDSSLNFTVKFWVNRPDIQFEVKSSVMHSINKALNKEGIVIPFPQRDIHIIGQAGLHE